MSLEPAFINKLHYLLTVGYTDDVITSFTDYCANEVFDESSIRDDLEVLSDSSIIESLQRIYNWNHQETNDFFSKLRQALDIDAKMTFEKHVQKIHISADEIDYNLSADELQLYKNIYLNECPRLLPMDQRKSDEALLRVLAIGHKNNLPLLQNVADTFCRVRINAFVRNQHDLKESQFSVRYSLLKQMKTRNQKQNARYLESALQSFHKRICPKLQFTSLLNINDSLSDYFEYTAALIKFIHNVIRTQMALPPFQIDFWMIPVQVNSAMSCDAYDEDEDDDDDDDDDDEDEDDDEDGDSDEKQRIDAMIGDIESRLQHEKLMHHIHTNPMHHERVRLARDLDKKINDFWVNNRDEIKKKEKKKYIEYDRCGAHKTRICIIVDRRKPQDVQTAANTKTWPDKMYIFTPPNDCNSIADDHCPESYLNASKQCLLPGKGYNNGQRMRSQCEFKQDSDDIDVGKPVGGYQFTLSFHVESANDIKCYIYYQGWIARFFPQDMINLWPIWFQKSKQNTEFINNSKLWKHTMNELQQCLCDDQFENWYKDSTKRDDLLYKF